jgi:FdhD protein
MATMSRQQAPQVPIQRWANGSWIEVDDRVAAEEPLQLSLDGLALSVVMRTPGNDVELALGLLRAEKVIESLADVAFIRVSAESPVLDERVRIESDLIESNQVDVHLGPTAAHRPERSFLSSSACGVCGATTVESLTLDFPRLAAEPVISASLLPLLADRLRQGQAVFEATGGLHAAGLFSPDGALLTAREDLGRHNAVDRASGETSSKAICRPRTGFSPSAGGPGTRWSRRQ